MTKKRKLRPKLHRHHLCYGKVEILVKIPAWYHWAIHVLAAGPLLPFTQFKWTVGSSKAFDGAIAIQNKAAKALKCHWLLGYPNPVQFLLNVIAWVAWGDGWLWLCFLAGIGLGLAITLN